MTSFLPKKIGRKKVFTYSNFKIKHFVTVKPLLLHTGNSRNELSGLRSVWTTTK